MLPIFGLAVFCWGRVSLAEDDINDTPTIQAGDVIINEIMWMGSSISSSDEWLELKNNTTQEIDFEKTPFSIYKDEKVLVKLDEKKLNPNDYFLISNNSKDHLFSKGESILDIDPDKIDSAISLSNSAVTYKLYALYDNSELLIDEAVGILSDGNGDIKKSMERNATYRDGTKKDNWHICCTSFNLDSGSVDCATPKHENSEKLNCQSNKNTAEDIDKASDYSGKVKINEIYSSPDTKEGEEEFIEIKNISNENISLENWIATDESHKGNPLKDNRIIRPGELYAFKGKFYLNLSNDTARIFDNKGILVDSIFYGTGKTGCRYALDDDAWRWTSQKTLGKNNEFDPSPSAKIKKDKTIYAKAYANFSAKLNDAVEKFSWDFGDNHKSYLEDTKHKFAKTKEYSANLTVSSQCEQKIYDFTVSVKKYIPPKIRIIKINPNPKGNDTENEWLEIKNSSKKSINLKGWSVATGWDNLVNHPIREDFKIKAGASKNLTHLFSAFTLANTKTKIELRDPSGKAVQRIEYDRGKNKMQEETIYVKESGNPWVWIEPPVGTDLVGAPTGNKSISTTNPLRQTQGLSPQPQIEPELIGKYSPIPDWENKIQNRNNLSTYGVTIKLASAKNLEPRVLGTRTEQKFLPPTEENFYSFTQLVPRKHWLEIFWEEINLRLNLFLMPYNGRKSNRLKNYDYSQNGMYFVTICTADQEECLGEIEGGKMNLFDVGIFAKNCWLEIPNHFPHISLDEFVVMPNHIHGIIEIKNAPVGNKNFCSLRADIPWQTLWARSVSSAIRGFKIGVKKLCSENDLSFSWQKSFHDRIVRNDAELNRIREYIISNPTMWHRDRNNAENIFI